MKIPAWILVKILIAAALLYWLFHEESITLEALTIFPSHPFAVFIVSILFFINMMIGSLRWKWLLAALNIHTPYRTLIDINFIGTFGNVFLPGGTGGDALRAYYIMKANSQAGAKALLSLIADRLLGIFGLMLFALGLGALYYKQFSDNSEADFFLQVISCLLVASLLVGITVLSLANRFQIRHRLKQWQKFPRLVQMLISLLDAIVIFKSKLPTVFACILLSLIMQLNVAYSLAILGQTLFGNIPSITEYMTAGSFSMLVNAIPLTPGGIGIGESAFDYFCRIINGQMEDRGYATAFFSFRLIIMLLSLIGAWRFIIYRHQHL